MKRIIPLLALTVVVLGIPVSLVVLPKVQAANLQKEKAQSSWTRAGFTCTWYKQRTKKVVRKVAGVFESWNSKDDKVRVCIGIQQCVRGDLIYYDLAACPLPSRQRPDQLCSEMDPVECSSHESGGTDFYFYSKEKQYFEERAKKK